MYPVPVSRASTLAVLLLAVAAGPAAAWFAMPEEAPVDRLVRNVTAYVKDHPKDGRAHYVLARIHALALAQKSDALRVDGTRQEGGLPDPDHPFGQPGGSVTDRAALRGHLDASLEEFGKAVALRYDSALVRLGRAGALEAGAAIANRPPPDLSLPLATPEQQARLEEAFRGLAADDAAVRDRARKEIEEMGFFALGPVASRVDDENERVREAARAILARAWTDVAIAEYRRAYSMAIEADLALPAMPKRGVRTLVAHEAGESWLRLVRERGVREAEKPLVEEVEAQVKALEEKPRRAITPVVFPLDGPRPLRDLLAVGRTAPFDLDGDDLVERWSWVGPETGILVWDPRGRGEIASGRQLLGSVTWWILWRDGYEALSALDDDRDGWLRGEELAGLAVWTDRDGNGRSDPGEVVPVAARGIEAIATRATGREDGCPGNPAGVRVADGRVLPSYDWIATRAGGPSSPRE